MEVATTTMLSSDHDTTEIIAHPRRTRMVDFSHSVSLSSKDSLEGDVRDTRVSMRERRDYFGPNVLIILGVGLMIVGGILTLLGFHLRLKHPVLQESIIGIGPSLVAIGMLFCVLRLFFCQARLSSCRETLKRMWPAKNRVHPSNRTNKKAVKFSVAPKISNGPMVLSSKLEGKSSEDGKNEQVGKQRVRFGLDGAFVSTARLKSPPPEGTSEQDRATTLPDVGAAAITQATFLSETRISSTSTSESADSLNGREDLIRQSEALDAEVATVTGTKETPEDKVLFNTIRRSSRDSDFHRSFNKTISELGFSPVDNR